MTKDIDQMTEVERMRRWIDIVDGKPSLKGCRIKSVEESTDGKTISFTLEKY